ncbi:hypothetical protein KAFR_0C04580 [Kazachstania africana CBS 2517]|uniref:Mannosyltransferase n=1 Tax=Kazachstania africana (strain ATCC 22294 / BCRC 22015 / CBS 2517 / CECT 1963 / NBRC 1671 / NRRL Y-8276) TaxID=1071382 RepID=H2ASU9_KAZAF|nr:hypothetical protein KAFR_0C04580 [Kazachstania africana CBS 2517]CCF57449.1 hypothetical protein KAFR_0C04580 [Kazachstania africana CBS 2517]
MKWSYLDTTLFIVISLHLINAPFTKVEESFNIQAIHDILKYGVTDISKYDHLQFPGVVPRTFLGALVTAAFTKFFMIITSFWSGPSDEVNGFETQLLARCIIGLFNGASYLYLKNAIQEVFDKKVKEAEEKEVEVETDFSSVGDWFIVFIISSFHLMFYSTRPLPNFILALPLVNVAMAWTLAGTYNWSIFLVAFTAIIFRLELVAIGSGIALASVYYKKISLVNAIKFGLMGLGIGMGISLTIDSYFWQRWGVPEIDAFIFNVLSAQASNWGTEPIFAYFTHYLLILFLPPTVLLLNYLGFTLAPENFRIITFAAYFHIAVLSMQPHKEWRFIVYAIPPIISMGSITAAYLWENFRVQSLKNAMYLIILPLSPIVSFALSMIFLYISTMNYPGGEALVKFNQYVIENNITNSVVHISVPPCMTGVTLFGEIDSEKFNITYDRTEDFEKLETIWPSFDYLITHESNSTNLPFSLSGFEWELINTTPIFTGVHYTYISGLMSQEQRSIPAILKEYFASDFSEIVSSGREFLDKTITKKDIFFTYKRKETK